ncbi:MAG: peptidylprolyl isomerase [Candidatus Levybacteria bacterium]|nr:peptidylprolyl isomerase [Candidatus Levybacteria bacterium]
MQKLQITIFLAIILIFAAVIVVTQGSNSGVDQKKDAISISQIPPNISIIPTNTPTQQQTTAITPPSDQFNKTILENYKAETATAVIKTSKGDIALSLYGKDAPYTVANFIKKAKDGYYNNLTFHRVEGWVIQGGDPTGDGTGGGSMPVEFNDKPFLRGSLGVASTGDGVNQNDSQFFITKQDSGHLDNKYTNFGMVTEGLEIVDKIEIGDKILGITIE